MPQAQTRTARREMRHARVRKKVTGIAGRPRLAVYRSLKHIYAQVIDDVSGATLAAASSLEAEVRAQRDGRSKTDVSKAVGALLAQRALAKGVATVVFDRGGFRHHGRVRALADAAREGGLVF